MLRLIRPFLALILLTAPVSAAPAPYDLQADKSIVGFSWFLGAQEIKGTMPVARAEMIVDVENVRNTQVSVAVDVAGAVAGFPFATQGMKSQSVLWAERFPEITFESTEVRPDGAGAKVDGLLTVRGVTRPVTFDAQLYRQRGTDVGDRRLLSIIVTGSLSRAAFGADGWADLAGDEVRLTILARIERAE